MTSPTPAAPDPTGGAVQQLPERVELDPYGKLVLAVYEEMERQSRTTQMPVMLDPESTVRVVLEADPASTGSIPRVPKWIDAPRSIGGITLPGAEHPDAQVTVSVPTTPGMVALDVTCTDDEHNEVEDSTEVPATDAEQWALNVLAAVRETRRREAEQNGQTTSSDG